jgi:energy-coupling factor transport system ATP-binding protein
LAEVAIMADIAVVAQVVGFLLPNGIGIQAVGIVPLAVVGYRHRPSRSFLSVAVSALISGLVGGLALSGWVLSIGMVGAVIGVCLARGRNWLTTALMTTASAGLMAAALSTGSLLLASKSRQILLKAVRSEGRGFGMFLSHAGFRSWAEQLRTTGLWMLAHWWLLIPLGELSVVLFGSCLAAVLLKPILAELSSVVPVSQSSGLISHRGGGAPVPVRLRGVSYSYPEQIAPTLSRIDIEIGPGELVGLVGANGSGKSTLGRILAGAPPTGGSIEWPETPPTLGAVGGTAVIHQRPESQVLGATVGEDMLWGLDSTAGGDPEAEIERFLRTVGLAGMAQAETGGLSGGQLQRLAVAAAMIRRPGLLVADEATSMLDSTGRRDVAELLRRLPHSGPSVVWITHDEDEIRSLPRVVGLENGAVSFDGPGPSWLAGSYGDAEPAADHPICPRRPVVTGQIPAVQLERVSLTYFPGRSYQKEALKDVCLSVEPGELVVVGGDNGSGKSSLAWLIAGLIRPSGGSVLIGGRPAHQRRGRVALAFQHARLQLLGPTAGDELRRDGVEKDQVAEHLSRFGLTGLPESTRLDQLSGGQLRRLLLAGLMGSSPEVLVMDEPLVGLDRAGRRMVVSLANELAHRDGLAVIVISHDLDLMEVSDREVLLSSGEILRSASL